MPYCWPTLDGFPLSADQPSLSRSPVHVRAILGRRGPPHYEVKGEQVGVLQVAVRNRPEHLRAAGDSDSNFAWSSRTEPGIAQVDKKVLALDRHSVRPVDRGDIAAAEHR